MRKKRKRRKKELPKTSFSLLVPGRAVDQEIMFGYAEYDDKDAGETIKYVQRADLLIHTTVSSTLHAGSMNSVHCMEDAGYTGPGGAALGIEEVNKFIKEKVITGIHGGGNYPPERAASLQFVR